ncbi:hypothetical protein SANTM175S_07887 [Streptomyces antimycoticus]
MVGRARSRGQSRTRLPVSARQEGVAAGEFGRVRPAGRRRARFAQAATSDRRRRQGAKVWAAVRFSSKRPARDKFRI